MCRTWCSVVHERVTHPPCRFPDQALPALLRCNLCVLKIDSNPSNEVVAALPTTLRKLTSWEGHIPLTALSRLVQLEVLDVEWIVDDDVRALGSMHTLTQLRVGHVKCSVQSAAVAAAGLTRLSSLEVQGETQFAKVMLLCGPTTLTRVRLFGAISGDVVEALHRAPLDIRALKLPYLVLLPLEQWPQLQKLDVGKCDDVDITHALLRRLALCTSLRKLSIWSNVDSAPVAHALGDLTSSLEELQLHGRRSDADDILMRPLPHFVHLTTLTLTFVCLPRGWVPAVAALLLLRSLKLHSCSGHGMRDTLVTLTQIRTLSLHHVQGWNPAKLPATLGTLVCGPYTTPDLLQLGCLTALCRLELLDSFRIRLNHVPVSWGSLVRLKEVYVHSAKHLPRMLLFDLEATLPALRIVELVNCAPVDLLPLTSQVRVVVVQ